MGEDFFSQPISSMKLGIFTVPRRGLKTEEIIETSLLTQHALLMPASKELWVVMPLRHMLLAPPAA
jgi:hypothetical protein